MRRSAGLICALVTILFMLTGGRASAGPYFNTTDERLKKLSLDATTRISDARIGVIKALTAADNGDKDRAQAGLRDAANILAEAIGTLKDRKSVV